MSIHSEDDSAGGVWLEGTANIGAGLVLSSSWWNSQPKEDPTGTP